MRNPNMNGNTASCLLYVLQTEFAVVYAKRSKSFVHSLHDTVTYKKTLRDHFKSTIEWQSEVFYVTRFFRNDYYQFNVKN